jgi:hypothetical protein
MRYEIVFNWRSGITQIEIETAECFVGVYEGSHITQRGLDYFSGDMKMSQPTKKKHNGYLEGRVKTLIVHSTPLIV